VWNVYRNLKRHRNAGTRRLKTNIQTNTIFGNKNVISN
jgi:hypothetical protein